MNLFKNLLVSQVLPNYQFDSNVIFPPGVLDTSYDLDDYLSKLDSDTRDYIIKHTGEFRTRDDIDRCISKLHK